MIGIIVATHGDLGQELIRTAEQVVGKIDHCVALSMDDQRGDARARFASAAGAVDDGDGILILTDMLGGAPANLGLSMLAEGKVEVLTGVNLPMLIKLASYRDPVRPSGRASLNETARLIKYYGQKNISVASEFLSG